MLPAPRSSLRCPSPPAPLPSQASLRPPRSGSFLRHSACRDCLCASGGARRPQWPCQRSGGPCGTPGSPGRRLLPEQDSDPLVHPRPRLSPALCTPPRPEKPPPRRMNSVRCFKRRGGSRPQGSCSPRVPGRDEELVGTTVLGTGVWPSGQHWAAHGRPLGSVQPVSVCHTGPSSGPGRAARSHQAEQQSQEGPGPLGCRLPAPLRGEKPGSLGS